MTAFHCTDYFTDYAEDAYCGALDLCYTFPPAYTGADVQREREDVVSLGQACEVDGIDSICGGVLREGERCVTFPHAVLLPEIEVGGEVRGKVSGNVIDEREDLVFVGQLHKS